MIREKAEIYPTIKVNVADDDETSVQFVDALEQNDYKIVSVQDVPTKTYGTKTTLTLYCLNDDLKYTVFINAVSMNNLVDAFGKNDDKWKDKTVKLSLEKDKKYNKDMIVIKAKE